MEVDDDCKLGKIKKFVLKAQNVLSPDSSSKHDTEFDAIIGHIEDLLIDASFQSLQRVFLEKYWDAFDDDEENKHCYMDIFLEYTNAVEEHIMSHLQQQITGFSMDTFISELECRKDELEGEVFEMLLTLTDFAAFKEMFVDYRKMKTGVDLDLNSAMCITSASVGSGTSI